MRRGSVSAALVLLAAAVSLHATAEATTETGSSFTVLAGYFSSADGSWEGQPVKGGSLGLALSADVATTQGVAIGILAQYGPFETPASTFSDGQTTVSGASGSTTLVALVGRSLVGHGSVRGFMGPGLGWLHTERDPITVYYSDGTQQQVGRARDDEFAIYLQAGVELGPETREHSAVFTISGAFATNNDVLGSSFWTVQLGLRLRFGGSD